MRATWVDVKIDESIYESMAETFFFAWSFTWLSQNALAGLDVLASVRWGSKTVAIVKTDGVSYPSRKQCKVLSG